MIILEISLCYSSKNVIAIAGCVTTSKILLRVVYKEPSLEVIK